MFSFQKEEYQPAAFLRFLWGLKATSVSLSSVSVHDRKCLPVNDTSRIHDCLSPAFTAAEYMAIHASNNFISTLLSDPEAMLTHDLVR